MFPVCYNRPNTQALNDIKFTSHSCQYLQKQWLLKQNVVQFQGTVF